MICPTQTSAMAVALSFRNSPASNLDQSLAEEINPRKVDALGFGGHTYD